MMFSLRLLNIFRNKKDFILLLSSFFVIMFAGCSYSPPAPVEVSVSNQKIDYLSDVKPILDKRCVSCHSCYNSPCQAKFSSFEGIDRGGSKEKVYFAERLFAQDPTRLFIDAKNTQEWRKKKFFSLTENYQEEGVSKEEQNKLALKGIGQVNSIMGHMLHDKKTDPEVIGTYAPEYDDLICPENLEEVSEYQDKHPNHGMPYGFPALLENEYNIIMQWLLQGAHGPSQEQQLKLITPSQKVKSEIHKWEEFLNMPDAKHQMTARYIYEHYFLAHMNFEVEPKEFYRLVRSYTPTGEPIDEIATRRPYDDPKTDRFYYRLQKIHSTLVHKTHIVVEIPYDELKRVQASFIDIPWLEEPHLMGYDSKDSANPFVTYAQIPPKARYHFMLKDSEYFVRTFIRGPVCKGQIALNVIHDNFWVFFQDPKYDIGVQDPQFLRDQAYNLSMPIEAGSSERLYRVFSDRYRDRYEKYYLDKLLKTANTYPQGFPLEAIWKGEEARDTPAITVYRHFDSATVIKGTIGSLPRTMWVIDYAQLERIYYSLVAGFDVFGNVSHQTNVRRYMDFLRLEGELNFLMYMPSDLRGEILASWYIGDSIAADIHNSQFIKTTAAKIGNKISFKTQNPKQEFVESLVDTHFIKETKIGFDQVNYIKLGEKVPALPKQITNEKEYYTGLKSLTAPGTGFVRYINLEGINLIYTRIHLDNGENVVGTFVINRWHNNVNSLFGESQRRDPSKDSLDAVEGLVGSYPNVFFDVQVEDLHDFFDMLKNYKENEEYKAKIDKYAISRSNKDFWKYYDWFQEWSEENDPVHTGLYDLNRYYKRPW